MSSIPPATLAELEACRQKLLLDIKEAETLFDDRDSKELATVKAGLSIIEEKIKELNSNSTESC